MRSRIASSVLAVLPLLALLADGQESSSDRRPGLLRVQGVRPEIIGNRLTILCSPSAHSRNFTALSPEGEPLETLAVQLDEGQLRLRYESQREGNLVLESFDRRQIRLQWQQGQRTWIFVQSESGPVHFQITTSGKTTDYSARGFWQLLLTERQAAPALIALLDQLRPNWRLEETADQIQQALLDEAGKNPLTARTEWQKWLNQLASADFATRVKAERRLRDLGASALGWLERQDVGGLDAEQRNHLQRLCSDLQPSSPDTPEIVASWLVDDKRTWLSFLKSSNINERTRAAKQLELLCHRSLAYDPAGEESTRQQQVAKLEARIAK